MSSEKNQIVKDFLMTFPGYNDGKWKMFCFALGDYPIDFLMKRFQEFLLTFTHCPSIAEILGTENQELAEIERAWQIFLKTMCNNYSFDIIPDEIYTIKRMLGEQRCEDITNEDLHWLKKEFEKCYKALKSGVKTGTIEIIEDPKKYCYVQIGASRVLLDSVEAVQRVLEGNPEAKRLADTKQGRLLLK